MKKHLLVAVLATILALFVLNSPLFAWLVEPVSGCVRADVWSPGLLAATTGSNLAIFVAYVWIPIVLVGIWRARPDVPVNWTLLTFAAFVVLCGLTHALGAWTAWFPIYRLAAAVNVATAFVSLATAALLTWKAKPVLLALPSTEMLRTTLAEQERTNAELVRSKATAEHALEQIRLRDAAIRELSTPVVPLDEGVLLSSIVGALDSDRAARLTEAILAEVAARRASVVILDLAGVVVVDTQVAAALATTARAVKLVGARCFVTGMRGPVATTMAELGVDLAGIKTLVDVRAGLVEARRVVDKA